MLATLQFYKATDERGIEITPDPEITLGVTRYVSGFDFVLFLRGRMLTLFC
jgi:hypothetical protein